MRILLSSVALLAACSPVPGDKDVSDRSAPSQARTYVTQVSAPTPDYARLSQEPRLDGEGYVRRGASVPPPADALQVGKMWYDRLEARHILLGAGFDGDGPGAAITMLDVGMTEAAFEEWAREQGWDVPRHISWTFVPAMNLPAVSDAAKPGIRFWPASSARTGAQNEALLSGRVELRDGCFWATQGDGEADKLAFFHAEIGLDIDHDGYYVLKDRVGGQTRARLGEPMNWGGPPSAYIASEVAKGLREACGDAPILVVGSPESRERFATKYPHTRNVVNPPPPANN